MRISDWSSDVCSSDLVVQTWLTSTVGNKVTGDLRVRLFEHLQSMELGFFTRTKTGVIQSRLQNDIGGVSGVLTNTVTSILGNAVTVVASLVAMILIDWRLRSEEHTSELQSLMRISYAVFCLKKKTHKQPRRSQRIKNAT